MYTRYFGLRETPFSIAPDPQYLYLSQRDREALAHFQYGINVSGGFVQLTGEVGTGKTMLIRALLEQLPEDVDVALVLNPVMTVMEFVAAICDEFRIRYPKRTKSLKVLVDALNAYLLENHAKGRRSVLIMDEAQNLSLEVLEQVRLLTNLETSKFKLLQIILVGQQELSEKLAAHNMRQLAQRITARYQLAGLKRNETNEYVEHRCQVAGANRQLFTADGVAWVHRLSAGNPRMINILCDRALMGAYSTSQNVITGTTVRRAAREVGESVPGRRWLRDWRWAGAAVAASVLLVAVLLWALWPQAQPTQIAVQDSPSAKAVAVSTKAVAPTPVQGGQLAQLLSDTSIASDTATAFRALFARWSLQGVSLGDRTGCAVAQEYGLRCLFSTGTWNNLRNFNRPTVIELLDDNGRRHHVLVSRLHEDKVSLSFGGNTYEFPTNEVDRYWFGKYLLLWRPPVIGQDTLRRGQRGEAVLWLREALARYQGNLQAVLDNDIFDAELEGQLMEFQRRHNLTVDGVVGQFTLMQLNTYVETISPPLLWDLQPSHTG